MEGCIFCGIAEGRADADIVHEDDEAVAFRDLYPQAPVHILVIPRRHIVSIDAMEEDDVALVGRLFAVARDLARDQGLDGTGYRLVTNVGDEGGQTVSHLHVHLLGGRTMKWPPG